MPKLNLLEVFEQYRPIFSYQRTWAFKNMLYIPFDKVASFTGNQWGKTAAYAVQYVYRIMGWHPIPYRNVLYFECPNLVEEEQEADATGDESKITHPFIHSKLKDGSRIPIHRQGTYSDCSFYPDLLKIPNTEDIARILPDRHIDSIRPRSNKCDFCHGDLRIHKRKTRIFRFCSEVLPGEKESTGTEVDDQSSEIRNATYPELKKWLPRFLIRKDITSRNLSVQIADPNSGHDFDGLYYKGGDIIVEFMSYSQQVQAGAGVQRLSCWCDEEPPFDFYDEQLPRLIAEDGDLMLSLTPARSMSWTYDEFFERAKLYIRTPTICAYLTQREGREVKQIEWTDSDQNIAVIQAATDDNPTLTRKAIEKKLEWEDPETVATRRYGVFVQSSGRIFSDFNWNIHFIDREKYFRQGIPEFWTHGRFIDYHERNPWAIGWVAVSPQDEVFVYNDWSVSPLKWVTTTISEEVGKRSGLQRYHVNLIDPLANKVQTNTGTTVVEDLNRIFLQLKKDGICLGGYWEPFDTKGTKGRDEIRLRLRNSTLIGKPFNNKVMRDGQVRHLPTLWVLNNCRETAQSLKQWRYEEWVKGNETSSKDRKEVTTQKHSHFCTGLEGLLKDIRFRARRETPPSRHKTPEYFKGAR